MSSFQKGGRYSFFVGLFYFASLILVLIFLFYAPLLSDLDSFNTSEGIDLTTMHLSYLTSGYVFGEIARYLYDTPLADEAKTYSFLDMVESLGPSYYSKGSFEDMLGFEACKAIEVSAWLYGIRSDVKRSLILAVSKEFNLARNLRVDMLDCFDFQTGGHSPAKKALRALTRKYGAGTTACENFLEKIAKIGRRSGFEISDVKEGLASIGSLLGLTETEIETALERAENIATDYDWKDFSADHFWRKEQSYNRHKYDRQNEQKSYSSRTYSSSGLGRTDHLKTLCLSTGATEKEIRSAYRKLAMKNHPDRVLAEGGSYKDVEAATDKMSALKPPMIGSVRTPLRRGVSHLTDSMQRKLGISNFGVFQQSCLK